MKINLPLGSRITDPIEILEEDLDSVRRSCEIACSVISEIYEGLKPLGVFVEIHHTEDNLVVRPKDVGGYKLWLAAFSFEVVLSQSHDYTRLCRVSAMTRPYMDGWELTVTAGDKAHYREVKQTKVSEDDFSKFV